MNIKTMRRSISEVYDNNIQKNGVVYNNDIWKNKVKNMQDNQVIAIYYTMLAKGKFSPESINNENKSYQITIDDILKGEVK